MNCYSLPLRLSAHILLAAIPLTEHTFAADAEPMTKETAMTRAFRGKPARIPGTIPGANFDEGGEGVAYHNIGPIHDPNAKEGARADGLAYRKADIEVEVARGLTQVAAMKAGEWMNYTVEVMTPGFYDLEMVMSCSKVGADAGAIRIEFDGVDKTGEIHAAYTGQWFIFKTVHLPRIELKSGFQTMRVRVSRGHHSLNLADIRFVPTDLTPPAAK